jgi:hypothetical protein
VTTATKLAPNRFLRTRFTGSEPLAVLLLKAGEGMGGSDDVILGAVDILVAIILPFDVDRKSTSDRRLLKFPRAGQDSRTISIGSV